jgi:hypothetical protein
VPGEYSASQLYPHKRPFRRRKTLLKTGLLGEGEGIGGGGEVAQTIYTHVSNVKTK